MKESIIREITPLKSQDCIVVFDRQKHQFDYPIHFHPEYELNFIANAQGAKRIVGDSSAIIKNRELVLTGPNLAHGWLSNHQLGQNPREITIQFSQKLLSAELLRRTAFKPIKIMLIQAKRGISFSQRTIQKVEEQILLINEKSEFDLFLSFQKILHTLANSTDQKILTTSSLPQQNNLIGNSIINRACQYLQSNYNCKELKINSAAQHVQIPAHRLNRLFKLQSGMSFIEFLSEIRLNAATQMLTNTDKSINEICYECGFNSTTTFYRIFKSKQGMTPLEYRKLK